MKGRYILLDLKKVNALIGKSLGIRFTRVNRLPKMNQYQTDPREGRYIVNTAPFSMELTVDNSRHMRWFSLNKDSISPFYVATKNCLDDENNYSRYIKIYKIINDYSNLCCPSNPVELLDLDGFECVFTQDMHPMNFSLPWDAESPEEQFNAWKTNTLHENMLHGLKSYDYLGGKNCSNDKIILEARRLHKLINSIKKRGFIYKEENLFGAVVLVNELGEFSWYVRGGWHRSGILAALGWKKLPVKVIKIVYRSEVDFWPGVKNKYYSKLAALRVFDSIYNAETPSYCYKWVDAVKSY